MGTASGKLLPVGARHVQIFELDTDGYPAASSTTVYEGLSIIGPKGLDLNIPDARTIVHPGGDGVLDVDVLASLEAVTAMLRVARNDFDVYALLTGTKVVTIGESKNIGVGTSKQGYEPLVGLLSVQQAHDENGARVWRSFEMPKVRVHNKRSGMNDQSAEHVFQLFPSKVAAHIWGTAFSAATDGFLKAFLKEHHTQYFPWICAWKGSGAEDEFLFHADRPAVSTDKINGVWVNGVPATPTEALTKLTFAAPVTTGDIIVCWYEIANPEEAA